LIHSRPMMQPGGMPRKHRVRHLLLRLPNSAQTRSSNLLATDFENNCPQVLEKLECSQ